MIKMINKTGLSGGISARLVAEKRTALAIVMAMAGACLSPGTLSAQAMAPDPDPPMKDVCLGPSSVRADGTITYETFMTSAVNLSPSSRTVTLPLKKGFVGAGTTNPVYYIVTDTSDCAEARSRHINYVPKLANLLDPVSGAPLNASVQQVAVDAAGIHFQGTADFSPVRVFVPSSPDGWPPANSIPGSLADPLYTPYITYTNAAGKHIVLNATHVANSTGIKDFLPQVDFTNMTATFNLVMGIYNFEFVMYLRMDASDPGITGFEGGIFATNPGKAQGNGVRTDDGARQTILPVLNGIRGTDQIYNRQGLQSSALGEGDPYNVMGATPGETSYSPIWDITPVVWTDLAIQKGKRQRLHQDDEVRNFVQAQYLMSLPGAGGNFNADIGIASLGVVSNCPIMLRVLTGLPTYSGGK